MTSKKPLQSWEVSPIIALAVLEAREKGFDKPHDVAAFVRIALDKAGLRISRKPSKQ